MILTEYHESARIDRQLFGRSARQGDPGTVQALVCLDDDAFLRYAPMVTLLVARMTPQGQAVPTRLLRWLVKLTQYTAEGKNRKIRLDTLRHDQQRREQMGFAGKHA